ncbi:MAG: leucine-rich repeat domain-containing protein [Clostridia bacterium]|nr:leucine-rich repeat domain-containing protein [Clostridia bacterium]
MNKQIHGIISVLLLLSIILFPLASCGEPEYAVVSEGNVSAEKLVYSVYEDGSASITGGTAPESGILVIPAAVDGHKVKSVADYAFEGNNDFFALIIEGAPSFLGSYAFSSCNSLTYADLGGTAYIRYACFSESSNLTECHSLQNVTGLEASAFSGCLCLTKAAFSKKLKSVGSGAFEGCISLSYFTLPSGVNEFGTGVFFACESLAYADLSSLKEIPDNTFTKCSSLVYPLIGNAESIGVQAFRGCSSLESVFIPKKMKSIGENAFSACDSLKTVNYGGSAASYGKIVFDEGNEEFRSIRPYPGLRSPSPCDFSSAADKAAYVSPDFVSASEKNIISGDFEYCLNSSGEAGIAGYKGTASDIIIPSEIDGHKVVALTEYAFGENTSVKSVDLGSTLTYIGEAVFYGCTSLADVKNGKSIRSVGHQAFYDTIWLKSHSDEEFFTAFDGVLIAYNGSSSSVMVPDGIKSIAGGVFTINDRLVFAYLPASVRLIGSQAFAFCDSLKLVRAPSVAEIGSYAFAYDVGMTCMELPSLIKCGENALCDCHMLKHADLGDLIEEISGAVFFNDQNLRTVCIGKSVKRLSAEIYNSCMTLINVYHGTREEFGNICVENGDNYLSDMILIPLSGR